MTHRPVQSARDRGHVLLRSMRLPHDPASERVRNALRIAALDRFSPEERAAIGPIESYRHELEASTAELRLTGPRLTPEGVVRAPFAQVGETCRRASTPPYWGSLLFGLVRALGSRAILEMGTCFGISAAYMASAQRMNGGGAVVTLEGEDALADLAREGLDRLGLDHARIVRGRFEATLAGALVGLGEIDFAFIDGHHDEGATVTYWRQVRPFLAPNAVVVVDDIGWSRGMTKAWRTIIRDGRVRSSIDLRKLGLLVLGPHVEGEIQDGIDSHRAVPSARPGSST